MKHLTHLSLFSGIGGLDLAAERAGFRTVGQCEFADYPYQVLCRHWPDVPKWRDICTLSGGDFYDRTGLRTVDVLSGGFPCQPFSVAGKRRGTEDDRYLWPEMLRVIKELRPAWVVGENVAGIINMALDQVLSDLEAQNYETRAFVIPACGVDAAETGSQLLPTITQFDAACGDLKEKEYTGTKHGMKLIQAVQMWPTPSASDCGRTAINPHITKNGTVRHMGKSGKQSYARLDAVAAMFPTPQARDFRTGHQERFFDPKRSKNPNDQIGGQLNPTWVEWLMGFPIGWTDLNA